MLALRGFAITLVCGVIALAQGRGGPGGPGGPDKGHGPGGPNSRGGPPHERAATDSLSGKWWTNPLMIRRLGLTEEQQKKLDQVYQQHRIRLIDLRAALEKEEALLDPMLAAEHPPETQVLSQIDRIANARADLEKANARMLFGFRQILTAGQWAELESGKSAPNRW
jgi:Spy/CpxP family protein refolding chaperone